MNLRSSAGLSSFSVSSWDAPLVCQGSFLVVVVIVICEVLKKNFLYKGLFFLDESHWVTVYSYQVHELLCCGGRSTNNIPQTLRLHTALLNRHTANANTISDCATSVEVHKPKQRVQPAQQQGRVWACCASRHLHLQLCNSDKSLAKLAGRSPLLHTAVPLAGASPLPFSCLSSCTSSTTSFFSFRSYKHRKNSLESKLNITQLQVYSTSEKHLCCSFTSRTPFQFRFLALILPQLLNGSLFPPAHAEQQRHDRKINLTTPS